MASTPPVKIVAPQTGLVVEREAFLLPEDAFVRLINAYVWREKIKRKIGCQLLGRLQRNFTAAPYFDLPASPWTFNIKTQTGYIKDIDITAAPTIHIETTYAHGLTTGDLAVISSVLGTTVLNGNTYAVTVVDTTHFDVTIVGAAVDYVSGGFYYSNRSLLATEPNAQIKEESFTLTVGANVFTDDGAGTIQLGGVDTGTINYATGEVVLTHSLAGSTSTLAYNYYPGLPVMGLRIQELNNINFERLLAFDTKYCYRANDAGLTEFIPGTKWSGTNHDFFWSTNWWTVADLKLFWATNFSGTTGDPIRYTDGITWTDFAPDIDASNKLHQCRCLIPYRGSLLALNTYEGTTLAASNRHRFRIRYSQIGNPLQAEAWRSDKRGKGGFLDIPTAEDIMSVAFIHDDLLIFCERSTWKLVYSGNYIAPFYVEKVNTEFGCESPFSIVQFDSEVIAIADRAIIKANSFSVSRMDEAIPDSAQYLHNEDFGYLRIHGIRDFLRRLIYWSFGDSRFNATYPNRTLVYNYDNGSWAVFYDTYTALGNYWPTSSATWASITTSWSRQNYSWIQKQSRFPIIVGGTQQGFVNKLSQQIANDSTRYITNITGNAATGLGTVITSPDHNLETDQYIIISGLVKTYTSLNGIVFRVVKNSADTLTLLEYDSSLKRYSNPRLDSNETYWGGGTMAILDLPSIVSKKFEYMDQGKKVFFSHLDILMTATSAGQIAVNFFRDYRELQPTNRASIGEEQDDFINTTINTYPSDLSIGGQTKYWHKVQAPLLADFFQYEYRFTPEQINNNAHRYELEIHAQLLHIRPSGSINY